MARSLLVLAALLLSSSRGFAAFTDESSPMLPSQLADSYAIASGDVDADGDEDLVVANAGQTTLLLNDGSGFYMDGTVQLPPTNAKILGVALGDVDGDGDFDLFLANASGSNFLLINDSLGNFADESGARLPGGVGISTDVVLVDLNQDLALDAVVARRGAPNLLLLNNGAGVYEAAPAGALPADMSSTLAISVGDVQGDGTPDLFFANDTGQNRLLLNDGLGAFSDATGLSLPVQNDETLDAELVDVDGDGDSDLVLANGVAGVALLVNDGGLFAPAPAGSIPVLDEYVIAIEVGDIDFDGSPDVFVATAGQDHLLLNDGAGLLADVSSSELPADDGRSFGAALVDVEGDFDLDLVVAVPQGENRLLLNRLEIPRIRISVSPEFIVVGDEVTIDVDVFDEDGVVSTILDVNGAVVSIDVDGVGVFVPSIAGPHLAQVTSEDSLGNVAIRSVSFNVEPPDLTVPQLILTVDAPPPLLVGQSVTVQATASDLESGIAGISVTVDGAPLLLDATGTGVFLTSSVGPHTVVASATDLAGNLAQSTETFDVLVDPDAPVITLSATPDPVDLTNPVSINVGATDNVAVASLTLSLSGPGITGDQDLAIGTGGTATFTPYLPGTFTITAQAADPGGNVEVASVSVEAVGDPDLETPVVTVSVLPGAVAVGDSVTVTVSGTDNILVSSISLEINGTPIALDANGSVVFTPPVIGSYTAVGTAVDPSGNEGTAQSIFQAVDPSTDTEAPVVAITSPVEGSEITASIDIIGTASDLTLTQYTIAYNKIGGGGFVTFATGSTSVTNGVLGRLNPGLLEDSLYRIRLSATDVNGLTSIVERDYVIESRTQPGAVKLSFADIQTIVAGVPITVIRSYDSRVKNDEDFGVGWTLGVKQGSYSNNRIPGEGWQILSGGGFLNPPCSISDETEFHLTRVRLSETESYSFRLQVNMYGFGSTITGACIGDAGFTQVSGPGGATLHVIGSNEVVWLSGGDTLTYGLGSTQFGFPWEPTDVRLTTADGRIFDLDLTQGLTRAEDANGNQVFITAAGITHSSGIGVNFTRDGQGRIVEASTPDGDERTYAYDAAGDLVESTDFAGFTTEYRYDVDHNLIEMVDPRGEVPGRLLYDDDGRLTGVVDADGNIADIVFDDDGQTELFTDRLGNTLVRTYDEFGNLASSTDPLGHTTTFTHDDRGNMLTRTDPLGNTETFTYDTFGNVLTYADAIGNTTTHTYDGGGRRLSSTDPLGQTESFEYDSSGNNTAIVSPRGGRQEMAYDATGLMASLTDAAGHTTNFGYDSDGLMNGFVDPLGRATTVGVRRDGKLDFAEFVANGSTHRYDYTYDANGNVTTISLPTGTSASATYDESGQIVSATNANGDVQSVEFNSQGDPSELTIVNGGTATIDRDLEGRVVGAQSPAGSRVDRVLDGLGRPISVELPSGGVATFEYDAVGRITSQQQPGRGPTTATYDASGRMLTSTAPDGGVTQFDHDAVNQLTAIVNPLLERTEFTYDAEGNVTGTLLPDGAVLASEYDLLNRLTLVRDERGAEFNYSYDLAGQLAQAVDSAGGTTSYTYDEIGTVTSATLPSGAGWGFTSNPAGVTTSTTYPWGGTETFSLDPAGAIVGINDAEGDVTTFVRNAEGNVLSTTLADGQVESRTYDQDGQLTSASDAGGTTTISHAGQGRVSRVDRPDGSFVEYLYDLENRLGTIRTPSGDTVYTYDSSGHLIEVADDLLGTAQYAYDLAGRLTTSSLPDGTTTTYTRSSRGWPTRIVSVAADTVTVIRDESMTYDAAGNPTTINELDRNVSYTYDGAGRIISETRVGADAATTAYDYDADWNLTQNGSRTLSYNAALQLTGDDIWTSYSYDATGRVSSRSDGTVTEAFRYDSLGRLTSLSRTGATPNLVELEYNEMQLVERVVVDGVGRRLLWDVSQDVPVLLEETTDAGALLRRFVHGLGPVGVVDGGQSRVVHQDRHGNVRVVTDDAGSVVDRYAFSAYGEQTLGGGAYQMPLRYAGELFVPEIGMYFLRSRFYDPTSGRFLTPDLFAPIENFPITYNAYLYAAANPVRFSDPQGNFSMGSISVGMAIVNILVSVALPHFPSPVLMIARAAGLTQADKIIGASFVVAYGKGMFTGGLQIDILSGGGQWTAVFGLYIGAQGGFLGSSGRNATKSPGLEFWLGSVYGISNEKPSARPGVYFFISGTVANIVVKYAIKPRNQKIDPEFGRGSAAIQFEIAGRSPGGGVEAGLGFKKAFTIYGSNWGRGSLGRQVKRKHLGREAKYAFASGLSLTVYIPIFSVNWNSDAGLEANGISSFW